MSCRAVRRQASLATSTNTSAVNATATIWVSSTGDSSALRSALDTVANISAGVATKNASRDSTSSSLTRSRPMTPMTYPSTATDTRAANAATTPDNLFPPKVDVQERI